jgi:hypothetical protein
LDHRAHGRFGPYLDHIRMLVFRLGFEAIIREGCDTVAT